MEVKNPFGVETTDPFQNQFKFDFPTEDAREKFIKKLPEYIHVRRFVWTALA